MKLPLNFSCLRQTPYFFLELDRIEFHKVNTCNSHRGVLALRAKSKHFYLFSFVLCVDGIYVITKKRRLVDIKKTPPKKRYNYFSEFAAKAE